MKKFLLVAVLFGVSGFAEEVEEKLREVKLEISLRCPESFELDALLDSIPRHLSNDCSYDEWKVAFVGNMEALIRLVESEKVVSSGMSWDVDPGKEMPEGLAAR